MIHILLVILKIIGILLLVILGILIFLVLVMLFVPVRYKVRGSWHSQLALSANVNWFLHIVSVRFQYTKDGLKTTFRVFGVKIFKNRSKDAAEDMIEGTEELLHEEGNSLLNELEEDEARYRDAAEARQTGGRESGRETGGKGSSLEAGDGSTRATGEGSTQDIGEGSTRDIGEGSTREYGGGKAGSSEAQEPGTVRENAKQGKFILLIKGIRRKIYNVWQKLRFSFTNICDKLKGINEFARDKKEWLEDEKNQASLKLLFRQAKRMVAHIWPVKGKGILTFGFDDPYTTGQVLQAVSLIYPLYHKQLEIHPVFDAEVLEAEGCFWGRIRLAAVAWLAIRVFLDRHTRRMIRGFIK